MNQRRQAYLELRAQIDEMDWNTPFVVMIVDNSVSDISALAYLANRNDIVVTIKKGGMSALRHLDDLNYEVDALITDLKMPYLDGINLTSQVRSHEATMADHKPIAIFWHTGFTYDAGNEYDPIMMAKTKFNVLRIFEKPADPIDLIAEVKEALER